MRARSPKRRFTAPSPLHHTRFRKFYVGWAGVSLGYAMQSTAAAWLMATLTPSAVMVALVQTASTAPMLLFGIFAGALADIVDRRRIMLITMIMVTLASAAFGCATLAGMVGPASLLLLTFLIGIGVAFYLPAQQSSINELVPRSDLPPALALGSAAFNIARAAGPAAAGAIGTWFGTGSALLAGAFCFVPTFFTLSAWEKSGARGTALPETLLGGVRSGVRYARHSLAMRSLLVRNVSFSFCASALWALLPIIARDQLGLDVGGYGTLSAMFGLGAVIAALCLGRLLSRASLTTVLNYGILGWVAAAVLIASSRAVVIVAIAICAAGFAWASVLSGLSAGTQSAAPGWVRSRVVALTLLATQGSMALGSALWGAVASSVGIPVALAVSGCLMGLLSVLNRGVRVELGAEADVTPDAAPPDLAIDVEPAPHDGPVMIEVHYQIGVENRAAFFNSIQALEAIRRRNGATDWLVFRDLEGQGRFVERFMIASWAEYTRVRTRMTQAERRLQDRVLRMQDSAVPVRISRLIGVDLR